MIFGIIVGVVVLVPLLIAPGLLLYYDITPKIAVLLTGTSAGLLAFAVSPSSFARSRTLRRFAAVTAFLFISVALSTVASREPTFSLYGTNWRRFGLLTQGAVLLFTLLAASYFAANPRRIIPLVRAACLTGCLAALYGVLQYFGWDPWIPSKAYLSGDEPFTIVRPPSTLGYANYFANYLVSVVFLGSGLLFAARTNADRLLGGATITLGSAAVVLSGTRGAMGGLVAGGVVLWVWYRPRLTRRRLAAAVLVCAGFVAFCLTPPGERLRRRVRWAAEDIRGGARLWLWRDSLRMAGDRWWTGYGPETFSIEFPRYQSKELANAYPDFYHESPHNVLLDAFTSGGIAALAGFLAILGVAFVAAGKRSGGFGAPGTSTRVDDTASIRGALLSALVASLASEQFTAFVMPTALYLYLPVTLLVASAAAVETAVPRRVSRRAQWVAVAAALAVCGVFVTYAVRLVWADGLRARASAAIARGDLDAGSAFYQRSLGWQLPGAGSDLWFSRQMAAALLKAGDAAVRERAWQDAFSAALRAPRTAEDPQNAWYNLAQFQAARNDAGNTIASLQAAISVAPAWFKPHWTLAQAWRLTGRFDAAEREASIAAELNHHHNEEVARTLNEIRAQRAATQK